MLLCTVRGSVVSTIKHPSLTGRKILVVELDQRHTKSILALDSVHAGVGDRVLVNQEGGSCRLVLGDENAPINHVIVGIVDH